MSHSGFEPTDPFGFPNSECNEIIRQLYLQEKRNFGAGTWLGLLPKDVLEKIAFAKTLFFTDAFVLFLLHLSCPIVLGLTIIFCSLEVTKNLNIPLDLHSNDESFTGLVTGFNSYLGSILYGVLIANIFFHFYLVHNVLDHHEYNHYVERMKAISVINGHEPGFGFHLKAFYRSDRLNQGLLLKGIIISVACMGFSYVIFEIAILFYKIKVTDLVKEAVKNYYHIFDYSFYEIIHGELNFVKNLQEDDPKIISRRLLDSYQSNRMCCGIASKLDYFQYSKHLGKDVWLWKEEARILIYRIGPPKTCYNKYNHAHGKGCLQIILNTELEYIMYRPQMLVQTGYNGLMLLSIIYLFMVQPASLWKATMRNIRERMMSTLHHLRFFHKVPRISKFA